MSDMRVQPGPLLYGEMSQLLYREARLLDEYLYDEWFQLLAPDIRYRIPARRSHYQRDNRAAGLHRLDTDHFDDDRESLRLRIGRLQRPGPSSLDPRPREVRIVSNIEVMPGDEVGVIRAYSTVLLVRNRLFDREDSIAARRDDLWRGETSDALRLVRRTVLITQNSVLASNMASFL